MKYRVALEESDEGYCVWVPGLPGCVSQGDTEEEALENIAAALREYLEVAVEQFERLRGTFWDRLAAAMDAMSGEAAANGLTPAALESLLSDES